MGRSTLWATGLLVGALPLLNLATFIYWPAIFLYLFHLRGWRAALRVAAIAIPMQTVIMAHNFAIYGELWRTTYDQDFLKTSLWSGRSFLKAFSMFFSPYGGTLVYNSVLLLGLWGLIRSFRKPEGRSNPEGRFAAICFLTHWVFFTWWFSDFVLSGGGAIAGRFIVPLLPLLLRFAPDWKAAKWGWRVLLPLSAASAYLSAQAGEIAHLMSGLKYTLKVAVSSWGMPRIFSEYLLALFNIETLHTVIRSPSVSFEDVLTGQATAGLGVLLAQQLPFAILFVLSLAPGLWLMRNLLRETHARNGVAPVPRAPALSSESSSGHENRPTPRNR